GRRSAAGDTAQSVEDLAVEQLIAKVGVEVLAPRSMEKAADVDRGQARKSLARRSRRSGTAPGRSACGSTASRRWPRSTSRSHGRSSADGSRSGRNNAWLRARSICDGTGLRQCQNEGLNVNGLFTS